MKANKPPRTDDAHGHLLKYGPEHNHWNCVLGPLRCSGLLEWRLPLDILDARCWQKTALFDRFPSFNLRLTEHPAKGHQCCGK